MLGFRPVAVSFLVLLLSATLCWGQDLSKYRDFQLGVNVDTLIKQVAMQRSDVRVVHVRPALIEELVWHPRRPTDKSAVAASLRDIRFTFHNDELFKMVVAYDPLETEGLTVEDVAEAISRNYGQSTTPVDVNVMISAGSANFKDTQKVAALWEDAQYSYSLFSSSYGGTFGLVIISKEVAATASAAERESIRLDEAEAPEREIARVKKQESDRRSAKENARTANKVRFRP